MKKILAVLVAIALVAVWQLVMASPTQASGPHDYHNNSRYQQGHTDWGYVKRYHNQNHKYGYQYYKPSYQNRSLYGSYSYNGRTYSPGFTGHHKSYSSNYSYHQNQRGCYYPQVRVYQSSKYHNGYANRNTHRNYHW